ncbi:unnamed protein product [Prorocentrum cordatum]|uniref:Uncharacterized protein n=1 Tax=Prorocentrum cordatum TaxID=2364126 RepID=A0ABN9T4G7_9DINO|nr:unnamed protein product [Polarella glacialis]
MPALRNSRRSQRLGPAQHPSGMGLDALVQAGIAEAHQAFKTRKKGDKRKHIEKATGMLTEAYQRSSALGDHQDLNIHLTAVLLKLAEAQGTVLGASLGSLELDAVWLQGPCTLVEEPDAPSPEPDEVEPSLEAPPRQDGRREHEEQHGAAEGALPAAAAAAAAPGAPPAGGSKVGLSTVQEADGDSAGSVSDGGGDSPARPEVAPACGSPGPAAAEPEEPSAVLRPSPPQAGADPAGPRRGLGRLLRGLSGAPAEAEEAAQPPQPQASPLALSPEGGEAPGARRGLGRLLENLGLGPAPAPDAAEEQQPSPQAHASPQAGAEAAADEAPRLARWWSRMVGSADIGPEASGEEGGCPSVVGSGYVYIDAQVAIYL